MQRTTGLPQKYFSIPDLLIVMVVATAIYGVGRHGPRVAR